ncbi:hypothetical protein PDJAM_G00176550 [Pangasius djambal]|uniref:Uncharacterized protein n=1 Tax=Pangasius djambal TaxID=1691987 RepID=A0ACC5ZN81_9TELE|nr:hypothetical protein [Pangasius djambal]
MTLMVCKRSKIEIEKKTKWWKLKKEECCEDFRQKLRQALGGQVVLPDDWETTAEVIRVTGRNVLGVSSGRRKEDKDKKDFKKKWDMDRTEENRQESKELQHRVKREVSKAKQEAYDELYTRLDTREGQMDLYRLARQRDRDGKNVQQVRVIKDRDGRVLTIKERNLEGQMVVDFAKRMDMAVVNTYFQKREEHRVTYKSGGRSTQVDYILCRRGSLKEISDCKVVMGESVARQHRMVVCRMTLMVCKKKRSKIEIEKKTKWWKLKKEECCKDFRQKLRQALGGQVVLPDDWETTAEVIRVTGRKVLGVSSGRRKEDKETWWDMDRTKENRQEYEELQRRVKSEVSKAKQEENDELYTRLDTREGQKDLYRLARQRDRDGKDVQQVRVLKDRDGRVLTSEESVQRRWKECFEELMNEENEREKRVEEVTFVEQKVDKIRKDEVRKTLKRMKSGKAVGPDDIPVEVWKCLGEAAVEFLTSLFNRVLESEKMPEEWRRSVLVPNNGDVQSCSNYRG